MSSEKSPQYSSSDAENAGLGRLRTKSSEGISSHTMHESSEKTSSYMNGGVVDSFAEMTSRGKEIIGDTYEKLYDVPVVNRVVGKIGVAYKSFWLDKHEVKAAKNKSKLDGFDMAMSTLDQAGQNLTEVIDNLKQQHAPGSEALQLKLKVIELQKSELQNKKDKIQTKFEAQSNSVKIFTNERDAIADKLIGRYEEKLVPLENGIDKLHHSRDHVEMEFSALNIRNQEVLEGINKIDEQKTKMEEGLKLAGMSDRAIRNFPAIKTLDDLMASRRTEMRTEKEYLTKRRNDIEKKIANADKKANPYRDKRSMFVRAKQGRPIDMEVETRSREKDEDMYENVQFNKREEQPESTSETEPQNNQSEIHETENVETNEGNERQPDILSHVSGWNDYLNDKYGKDNSPILVDIKNFSEETGLMPENTAHIEDFADLLDKYYKYKKIPMESIKEDMRDFLENYSQK